jgi:hypothetical protein
MAEVNGALLNEEAPETTIPGPLNPVISRARLSSLASAGTSAAPEQACRSHEW